MPSPWRDPTPLRDTLLSGERLEEHARNLAYAHSVAGRPARRYALARRVADNARALHEAYRSLAAAATARETISPAGEWLIDNYHIIERQIRDIHRDLPPGYYRRLPKLATGPLRGYPRILGAMWQYVAHTDSHFSTDVLCRYFRAYQQVQPLTIGELWAAPITLRMLLVENIRRFAEAILLAREARRKADSIADRILAAGPQALRQIPGMLSNLKNDDLVNPFIVQLAQRLRDQDQAVAPALDWLDQRLGSEDTTVDEVVQAEQQREINATITVRNIITSMRLANDVDWRDLFERMSLVHEVLVATNSYFQADFATRDQYRGAVEQIARGAKRSELEIARGATAATDKASANNRLSDPGYFLISGGRPAFERAIGYRAPIETWAGRIARSLGIGGYIIAGSIVSAGLLAIPLWLLAQVGVDWRWLAGLGTLGAVPAIDAAVSLVNYLLTRGLRATLLPSVELADGVPVELRTIVVVPTLLTSQGAIEEQVERLEVHYLSSPKGEIYFALLSDWTDAASEHAEGDEELLAAAAKEISALNRKYGAATAGQRFTLLHRRRVWTESEGKWIGWERKRGKLNELNELLRGSRTTTFVSLDGKPVDAPPSIRYVITLDADTRLTLDAVRRLIGKMAHPLNRARLDPQKQRVVEGYAILQPRVTPSMPVGREATPFLRVFSSMTGIDPYAAAASDVYQDLLGEGSYTGKGIYDVDAFRAALANRIPPSSLLSHDLFEGVFARAGLVSDVEFVEEFPARYDTAALRHHRWARGDWQLLPWIFGLARSAIGTKRLGGVPIIGRWKMLDNIRRTASAPAAVAALLVGLALPFPAPLIWAAFVLVTLALPPLLPMLALLPQGGREPVRRDPRAILYDIRLALTQWFLATSLLAHQAWLMSDAALRTVLRLATRKKLLEWTPAAQARIGAKPTLANYYRYMIGAPIIGAAAVIGAWLNHRGIDPLAASFALLWWASPAVAVWASSTPTSHEKRRLSPDQAAALRLVARKTWRYFETFVTPAHNMLPPDNFQEDPEPVAAQRTSPTNIGLYLLSTVAAHNLGWVGLAETAKRLEATLETLNKLARYRGHFYNWYDTRDLRALEPHYVSSVDSGNLAGHLIAVAGACRAWSRAGESSRCGVLDMDAMTLAREEARLLRSKRRLPTLPWPRVEEDLAKLEQRLQGAAGDKDVLAASVQRAGAVLDVVEAHALGESDNPAADLVFWLSAVINNLKERLLDFDRITLQPRMASLAQVFRDMALSMDFSFLLDRERLLLSIGYRGSDAVLDPSCYDLLASEARLASLFTIAKGDAPHKHWFRLNHSVTMLPGGPALISWSGSMFEYLMPSLVMQEPVHSLLERTNRAIVQGQIEYGRRRRVPWGVSESAYNARDLSYNYQYSNFGVPSLGLKRGLADDVVIAPYATALASMVWPTIALRNFEALSAIEALGRYGYYEAVDFTPERLQDGQRAAIVRSFMAHHQGMTISAIANVLCDGVLRRHFHSDPMIQSAELLLQERMPREINEPPAPTSAYKPVIGKSGDDAPALRSPSPWGATPATHLMSNGRYSLMLTAAGSGASSWRGLALTRWREDATCDDWGSYIYIRDTASGVCWSPTLQPTCHKDHEHSVVFDEGKAGFTCRANGFFTQMDVILSQEDDAEVRRVTLSNTGSSTYELEITSYVELALTAPAADRAHPAFSKLFIETEHLTRTGALLARRRRRAPEEPDFWAAHIAIVEGNTVGQREFETDRTKFIGRGRDLHEPIAILSGTPLSCSAGATLDPIFAVRRRVRIEPGGTARIHFWTFAAASRQEALELIDKHNDITAFDRAEVLAWTQAQIELHHIGIDRSAAALYQRLASHLVYANPAMRPARQLIARGAREQSQLWSMGLSGDLPIMLVRIAEASEIGLVEEALQALEYFRTKRLAVDLVILNERPTSYQQDLQNAIEHAVRTSQARPHIGADPAPGHTYVLRSDLIAEESRNLLASAARVVLQGDRGRLVDQMRRRPEVAHAGRGARRAARVTTLHTPAPGFHLEYFNGLGGFVEDGKEYAIVLGPGQTTPAPWVNVIANADFGFLVSESGAGFAWSGNSREHQLTHWSNDPVCDQTGQAFFIRDRDTGELLSPTAAPLRDPAAIYVARHGKGYSRFEHEGGGLSLVLLEYVPVSDPLRISRLRIANRSSERRRLSVYAYVEWTLGSSRTMSAPFVVTSQDATGAILAVNRWNAAFKQRVAFADLGGRQESCTGDRREFIGRNGSLSYPAALASDAPLSGRLGAGLDPCTAMRTDIEIAPGESVELVFLVGDAESAEEASELIRRYRSTDLDVVLDQVRGFWDGVLGSLQIRTPDRSLDLMVNGWLLYQTLACRVWARAGFYQASGAYGFRDQLQDVMALAIAQPSLTREHLLRSAARQFPEGDVQHWWLPHTGQGVRTRITDDRVWLPVAVAHYIAMTNDWSILDEEVPFLAGRQLEPDEAEAFFRPETSFDCASLYEHCARALDVSLSVGRHGIPLMGGGDWNDGMNRVGLRGQGESVWLGWFLHSALTQFSPIADARSDVRAGRWRDFAHGLGAALEREAWDGDWYRRGWFDDGTALGSAASAECRIDSIAQSWAVLSKAGNTQRARRAMDAVERDLIRSQDAMALLFAPPFDQTPKDPGYIKGYPPGVRENGGQYTHGAVWSVMALAALGEGDKAAALFWMLNPINHARTRTDAHRYRVEPYVIAADIYAAPALLGRGGWTWYTGSAGLMYRAGVESILGLRIEGSHFHIDPCIPRSWPGFEMTLRLGSCIYEIRVKNPAGVSRGVARVMLDGKALEGDAPAIPIGGDGQLRRVEITLGSADRGVCGVGSPASAEDKDEDLHA